MISLFFLHKNVVCSVLIGLGRIDMWKTVIWHINASIFVFFILFFVISTNIFQRSCWKLNSGFYDRSEETLTTSQIGSWRKKTPFYRVSVLAHFCPRRAWLPHTQKKKDCFTFALKLLKPSLW